MARLGLQGRIAVAAIGLLFTVLFGLLMPWWLFLAFLFVLGPMFYRLLTL
jgi:hypothetical protein